MRSLARVFPLAWMRAAYTTRGVRRCPERSCPAAAFFQQTLSPRLRIHRESGRRLAHSSVPATRLQRAPAAKGVFRATRAERETPAKDIAPAVVFARIARFEQAVKRPRYSPPSTTGH